MPPVVMMPPVPVQQVAPLEERFGQRVLAVEEATLPSVAPAIALPSLPQAVQVEVIPPVIPEVGVAVLPHLPLVLSREDLQQVPLVESVAVHDLPEADRGPLVTFAGDNQ